MSYPFNSGIYDGSGSGVTGSTDLVLVMLRHDDDYLYDFDDSTFKAAGWTDEDIEMTEIDATNLPGEYRYSVDVSVWDDGWYTAYFKYGGTPAWTDAIDFYVANGVVQEETIGKLDDTLELDVSVYRFTANAVEEAPSGSGAAASTIADAVLDELLSGHVVAGSLGKVVADTETDIGNLNNLSAADVGTQVDASLATYDPPTRTEATSDKAEVVAAIGGLNNVSAAQVRTQVDNGLAAYDPPTRAELTTDKNSIIAQVDANETKIDTMQGNVTSILGDTSELQGLISSSKIAAQVKGIDANAITLDALHVNAILAIARQGYMDLSVVKASGAVVAQGITGPMATAGCIQYETVKISKTRNFASPDATIYLLFHYDASGKNDEVKADTDTTW